MASASTPVQPLPEQDDQETLRQLVQAGVDELDRGETVEADEVFAMLWERQARK